MRPGDFSPGNVINVINGKKHRVIASMRPGDFSPGNVEVGKATQEYFELQ